MDIKVYSTSICPACDAAKKYLKDKGLVYEEYNVEYDEAKAIDMINISGQTGVPVIDINGNILVGFSKQRIDSLIY
jgi:glutaredoxin-like YruB-family protein